jgi:hypothetical protein
VSLLYFLNSYYPNLGEEQIWMWRETCETGQLARVQEEQTDSLASSVEVQSQLSLVKAIYLFYNIG